MVCKEQPLCKKSIETSVYSLLVCHIFDGRIVKGGSTLRLPAFVLFCLTFDKSQIVELSLFALRTAHMSDSAVHFSLYADRVRIACHWHREFLFDICGCLLFRTKRNTNVDCQMVTGYSLMQQQSERSQF